MECVLPVWTSKSSAAPAAASLAMISNSTILRDPILYVHLMEDICRAPAGALQISLGSNIAPQDYYFSGLFLVSHDEHRIAYDRCMSSVSNDLLLYLTDPVNQYLRTFYKLRRYLHHGHIRDFFMAWNVLGRRSGRRRSGYISVSPDMPYVTAVSLLVRVITTLFPLTLLLFPFIVSSTLPSQTHQAHHPSLP